MRAAVVTDFHSPLQVLDLPVPEPGAGEVLVSSTVRDLVVGSGMQFDDRGLHELKGVPDPWRVLALLDGS